MSAAPHAQPSRNEKDANSFGLKGNGYRAGVKPCQLPTFPSRSRQGRSARHPARLGRTVLPKRRWDTMRRCLCWKGKNLSTVMPDKCRHCTPIWHPFRYLSELHRFSSWHRNGMVAAIQVRDDGGRARKAVPHLPPRLHVARQRDGYRNPSPAMMAEGDAKPSHTHHLIPDKCRHCTRSGIHSVTCRNCTASACGTTTVWIPHQVRDDGGGGYEAVP